MLLLVLVVWWLLCLCGACVLCWAVRRKVCARARARAAAGRARTLITLTRAPSFSTDTHTHTHYLLKALKANPTVAVKELKLNANYITRFGQVALSEAVDMVYEMGGQRVTTVHF